MRTSSYRTPLARVCSALLGAAAAVAIGAAVDARQAQTPSTQAPPPSTPAQPGQPGRGRAGGPDTRGPVRGPGGEIIGFTNLAEIPGTPWRIHDAARPHPRVVAPGATTGAPPADAIVLFDGKDLSKWAHSRKGQIVNAEWPVREGYFETGTGTGSIVTREKFGDVQLHLEFATPSPGKGASQDRGNSGVSLMGRYEVQVLDSFEQRHLRRRTGRVHLRRVSTARQRRAPAR